MKKSVPAERNNEFIRYIMAIIATVLFSSSGLYGQCSRENVFYYDGAALSDGSTNSFPLSKTERTLIVGKTLILAGLPFFMAGIFVQECVGPNTVLLGIECNKTALYLGTPSFFFFFFGVLLESICKKELLKMQDGSQISVSSTNYGIGLCLKF